MAGKTIGILGLSFKPETDDMREAPALTIIPRLVEMGAHIKAHDPASMKAAPDLLPGVELVADAYAAGEGADAVVLITEWNQYRALDLQRLKEIMAGAVFVDLRNVYEPARMKELGFEYSCVGR